MSLNRIRYFDVQCDDCKKVIKTVKVYGDILKIRKESDKDLCPDCISKAYFEKVQPWGEIACCKECGGINTKLEA